MDLKSRKQNEDCLKGLNLRLEDIYKLLSLSRQVSSAPLVDLARSQCQICRHPPLRIRNFPAMLLCRLGMISSQGTITILLLEFQVSTQAAR
jgi:hypothetical protein